MCNCINPTINNLVKKKLTKKQIQQFIVDLFLLGQTNNPNFRTENDVINFLNKSTNPQFHLSTIIDNFDYNNFLPFEDVFGGAHNGETGKFNGVKLPSNKETIVDAPGILHMNYHLYQFSYSFNKLNIGIDNASILDIQTAFVFGIASIECFINEKAQRWNENFPYDAVLDSKSDKTSFSKKIDNWIPKFTSERFDKSNKVWKDFLDLQAYRDNEIIHSRNSSFGITYKTMIDLINKYQAGIAGFHKNLHLLFEQQVPHMIIRAMHLPLIELN